MYIVREVLNCKPGNMANDKLRKTMADYHDLVESGRREIYRLER